MLELVLDATPKLGKMLDVGAKISDTYHLWTLCKTTCWLLAEHSCSMKTIQMPLCC